MNEALNGLFGSIKLSVVLSHVGHDSKVGCHDLSASPFVTLLRPSFSFIFE